MAYEPLLLVDKTKLEVERLPGGKFYVRSNSWDEKKIIFRTKSWRSGYSVTGAAGSPEGQTPRSDRFAARAYDPYGPGPSRLRTTFAPVREGDRTPFAPSPPERTFERAVRKPM